MIKIYKPNVLWIGLIIGCLGVTILLVIPSVLHNPGIVDNKASLVGLAVLVLIVLYPLGRCATITKDKFCHVDYFFWKKCLTIENIETITYLPTFGIGNANRTLKIREKVDTWYKYKEIIMPTPAFNKKTLTKVVRDLLQINPNIQIDANVEKLLRDYEN